MSFYNEKDNLQCSGITDKKKRCSRIGTHSNGGEVLCESCHRKWMVKRANDVPIVKKEKK